MAQTTVHHGPASAIAPDASAGLLFLQRLLPALDSLDGTRSAAAAALLAPGATFTVGAGPAVAAEQMLALLAARGRRVARLSRELQRAWDVAAVGGEGGGRRTVLFESTSTTVFREDPEARELAVREFSVLDLVAACEGEGEGGGDHGFAGLKATNIVTFMDAAPVRMRAAVLFGQQQMAG